MREFDDGIDGHAPEDCSTTGSFEPHGIDDGADLVSSTYYRLVEAGVDAFEPTTAFFDRLESAFLWAYLGSVDEAGVPPHVEYAVADARAVVEGAFEDAGEVDLRTDVVPTFYREVAGFHCMHRE